MSRIGLLLLPCALVACERPCGETDACAVQSGRFYAFEPEGWDGASPLPVVVHLHGYGGSPEAYFADEAVRDAFSDGGALWVLPEGRDRDWNAANTRGEGTRDEIAFLGEVVDAVAEQWPVDAERIGLSGHSLGASVVYDAACAGSERFVAYAPSSGTFWEPLPSSCAPDARPLLHTHGRDDAIWPLDGRAVDDMRQGDVEDGLDRLASSWGCSARAGVASAVPSTVVAGVSPPTAVAAVSPPTVAAGVSPPTGAAGVSPPTVASGVSPAECRSWACPGGAELRLCLYDGGHTQPAGWVGRDLAFFFQR